MTRQRKRKVERNSKKKQTSKFNIFSTSLVDTNSIIDNNCQLVLLHEDNLNNHLKKNRRLMETIVIVNIRGENQNNLGVLIIIHEHSKDLNSENLILSAINGIKDFNSELKIESILNATLKVDVLEYVTYELMFETTKSISESINDKILIAAKKLIEFQKQVLEAA